MNDKNRIVILPHVVLLIEGRILCILYVIFVCVYGYQVLFHFAEAGLLGLIIIVFMIAGGIYLLPFLWPACWGELVITNESIKYRGLFLPTIVLQFDEIAYVDIRTFREGNVAYNANANVDAFKFLLLSPNPLPTTAIQKINSSKKNKLIKYPISQKLCESIDNKLKENQRGFIKYQLYLYKRSKKK